MNGRNENSSKGLAAEVRYLVANGKPDEAADFLASASEIRPLTELRNELAVVSCRLRLVNRWHLGGRLNDEQCLKEHTRAAYQVIEIAADVDKSIRQETSDDESEASSATTRISKGLADGLHGNNVNKEELIADFTDFLEVSDSEAKSLAIQLVLLIRKYLAENGEG